MKYILILYMCSMANGQCPSNSISGLQYNDHFDCVVDGYRIAHNTFKNLEELEEYDKEYINRKKLVIKFECKQVGEET